MSDGMDNFNVYDFDEFLDMVIGHHHLTSESISDKITRLLKQSDLIIRNVRSSCGCTAVAPSKNVIAPGETAPIKVTFDSRWKRGRQSKSITVITNDPKTPTNILRVSCNVEV